MEGFDTWRGTVETRGEEQNIRDFNHSLSRGGNDNVPAALF